MEKRFYVGGRSELYFSFWFLASIWDVVGFLLISCRGVGLCYLRGRGEVLMLWVGFLCEISF